MKVDEAVAGTVNKLVDKLPDGLDAATINLAHRVLTFLGKHNQGVPRSALHAISANIKDVHAILNILIEQGIVKEVLISVARGKPSRRYILADEYINSIEQEMAKPTIVVPGARECIIRAVKENPNATRTVIWRKAIPGKQWIGNTLDILVREGVIIETLATDASGGLVRHYNLADEFAVDEA